MRGARFQTRHLGDPWAPPWTLDHNTCTETTSVQVSVVSRPASPAFIYEPLKYTLVGLNNATADYFLAVITKLPIDLLQQFLLAGQIQ